MDKQLTERNNAKEDVRRVYDALQIQKVSGDVAGANAVYDKLSDQDKKLYQDIKSGEKTKATNALKAKLYPLFVKLQELKAKGQKDYADSIYYGLSDEEQRVYSMLKKQFVNYE